MHKLFKLNLDNYQKQQIKNMLLDNSQLYHEAYLWKQSHKEPFQTSVRYLDFVPERLHKECAIRTIKRATKADKEVKYRYRNIYINPNRFTNNQIELNNLIIPFDIDTNKINILSAWIMYKNKEYYLDLEIGKSGKHHMIAIDVGVDNLGACVTSFGDSFLVDGKKLKAYDYYCLKKINFLQGINSESKKIDKIKYNHYHYLRTYCEKASNIVKQYCIDNGIDFILMGKIPTKKSLSYHTFMGMDYKRDNITAFGMSLFVKNIKHICKVNKWEYSCIAEDYSSQCSFYDDESVKQRDKHFGRRVHRGLYRTKDNNYVNADINAAYNFFRKYVDNIDNKKKKIIQWKNCKQNLKLHTRRVRVID